MANTLLHTPPCPCLAPGPALRQAGDQSEYVGAFRRILLDSGARLGPAMPANYFRFFCDKLLHSLAPRFVENVFRCKKISDVGCQQVRWSRGMVWPWYCWY